ncbi:MAG TPA: DUF3151 family protein [Acidimicrobiales bacterium]|nr:DUF3151 family protein [Acidimicrobiales bacterium]
MSDQQIDLGQRPPETVLGDAPDGAAERLSAALLHPPAERRAAVADVVGAFPAWPEGWARLGELARDDVEAYACFRVGYHRGLDALRGAGWRGSGYVRWRHPTNRGFLSCVEGLRAEAERIGEAAEAERCALFLRQLDPDWPPSGRR